MSQKLIDLILLQYHFAQTVHRASEDRVSAGSFGSSIRHATGLEGTRMSVGGPKTCSKTLTGKMQALSREARSNQRRLLTAFGIDTDSDLLKFNQLKVKKTFSNIRKKTYCRIFQILTIIISDLPNWKKFTVVDKQI